MENFGYFKVSDPMLLGLKFGNWGSRHYEYLWAVCSSYSQGKDILDFGVGMPQEHDWNEYVRNNLSPKSYLGIDKDPRMKDQEINEPTHKCLYMDGADLKLPDNSIDLVYSISSFEHIDDLLTFEQVMKELRRVMRPGANLVMTLDEYWDCRDANAVPWNNLERARIQAGLKTYGRSYGICDFAADISEWFTPLGEPPEKTNCMEGNGELVSKPYNDIVSYGVFLVKK